MLDLKISKQQVKVEDVLSLSSKLIKLGVMAIYMS